MTSLSLIGAFAGLVVAGAYYLFVRELSRRVDLDDTRRALRISALVQFLFFPVAGWFVLPALVGD